MIYKDLEELIGDTKVIKINGFNIKLEGDNLGGSIKDRVALNIIKEHEAHGDISKGDTLITATSGNTGIGLALAGAIYGYKIIICMPENMSVERIKLIKAYNADVLLTPANEGMPGAIKKSHELAINEGYYEIDQFKDMANPRSHEITAREIIKDFEKLDYFVSAIGSGGTITGVGMALKRHFPQIKIIGIEPSESPVLSKGIKGKHGIQGIGAGFIPEVLDEKIIDEIQTVSTEEAYDKFYEYAKKGLFLGISSGAAIKVCEDLLKKHPESTILMISPDGGIKYLSMIK